MDYTIDVEMLGPDATEMDLANMVALLRAEGYETDYRKIECVRSADIPDDVWQRCLDRL
jgi:hypothetical protein